VLSGAISEPGAFPLLRGAYWHPVGQIIFGRGAQLCTVWQSRPIGGYLLTGSETSGFFGLNVWP